MNQRRSVVCVVAACLAASMATACAARGSRAVRPDDPCMADGPIQKDERIKSLHCRPAMNPREALLYGGEKRDGFVHFRIAYDHDVEPWQRRAFQGAMALWNEHSHETGFVFEDTTSATIDIRFQRGAPAYLKKDPETGADVVDEERIKKAEENTCAEYVSSASYIWYSPVTMNWVTDPLVWLNGDLESLLKQSEFRALARIYAHELGHALNINHKQTQKSVMVEGELIAACRDKGVSVIEDVQPADARDARDCGCYIRRQVRAPR